jgi:HEAT repeat protein
MSDIPELSFQTLIDALLDEDTPFNPRYLYRLSDLEGDELALFYQTWSQLSLWRRQALMEDLYELGRADNLLSFENIGRKAIADEDPRVRLLAVQILWVFEELDLVPIYLQLLDFDPVVEVRAASASGLGQFVYLGEIDRLPGEVHKEIEDRLLNAFHHDQETLVQCRALESVGYSSRSEIPGIVEYAFASNDHKLVVSALIAMGRSQDSRWKKAILSMLNHKLPAIRAEAARAAGEIELKDAVSTLVELTTDSEDYVRSAAIWSLSEIGGERARHTLEKLFQEADDDEADFLESALDNVAFTDGMHQFSFLDLPEDDPEEEEFLEMLISQENSTELNGDRSLNAIRDEEGEFLDSNDEGEGFQD